MLGALFGAVWLLRPLVPSVDRNPLIAVTIALTFYPMFRAITGGQNTALTALIIAAAMRLEQEDRPFLAGLAAAGLLYKPQFGLPIAALLVLARRWPMMRGWLAGAVAFFAVGAVASGPDWVGAWWSDATGFAEINEGVNGYLFVSLPGMVANQISTGGGAGRLLWIAAFLVAVALALYSWLRPAVPLERWGLTSLAVVLVLPQALFYEVGLALFTMVAVGSSGIALSVIWVLSWTQPVADTLQWSPLGLVAPATLVWAIGRVMSDLKTKVQDP